MTQPLGPNQEAWLKALESGEWEQGHISLRDDADRFCCLGVACELSPRTIGIERLSDWLYDNESAVAPPSVIEWLGRICDALTKMNDDGKSFDEIAAIIRSDPSVYFKEPR